MKDKTQVIGWIILFLIASGFIGFSGAWILDGKTPLSYPLCALALTGFSFLCFLLIFRLMLKKMQKQALWAMLKRGCFHEVDRQIDENSKAMKQLWELKMLACFHSGNKAGFERLYNSYMNEINECKTLGSYMLCVLHELLDAMSHDKPPAVFLKNDSKKRSYIKQRDYQLYYQIQSGIQEYYGSQKQLMKIYFEKFLIQTDVLSKPLGFYLYYLMTTVMVESDHPQWEDYYRKTQQYVFDQESLKYMEKLKTKIYGIQKGTGNLQLMNRDMNRTRRNNPLYEDNQQQTLNRSFNYQQPSFRRERSQMNLDPRHSANVQKEFDEMNSTLNENNTFSLYEDDEMDLLNQKRKGAVNENTQVLPQEDLDDDLDPTWFARKNMDSAQTQSFAQPTPAISEPANTYQKQQPMNQNPDMQSFGYQNERSAFMQDYSNRQSTPAFVNQRSQQTMGQELNNTQTRNTPNGPQAMFPNQANTVNTQQAYMRTNQLNQRRNQMDEDMMQEPYQAYAAENTQQINRTQTMSTPVIEKETVPQKQQRKAKGRKQKKKQDPFDFQEEAVQTQETKRKQKQATANTAQRPYATYVHQNVIVFFISLLDAALVSVTTSSVVYTNFFKRYTSVNSEIVTDIIIKSLIISLIAAYLTASIHTGYTILKKSLQNWKTPVKVLLSPLLFVISLLIGVICEIPYFIFASIKKGKEKA